MKAILVKSAERFEAFRAKLQNYGIETTIIEAGSKNWLNRDFGGYDLLIYFPTFQFSSNSPLAHRHVVDFIRHMHLTYPTMAIFPDPLVIDYYNDKYRQFLFLKSRSFPIPPTVPLESSSAVEEADQTLGYPMVLKNRHGAGGGAVFIVNNKKELLQHYRLSIFDFWNLAAVRHFLARFRRRLFLWHLIKARRMTYPFYSAPLIAQQFVQTDRDVRVVVGDGKVIEAHWRIQASASQWKVNIDAGGIGEWSAFPDEVLDLGTRLARELGTRGWVALDALKTGSRFLITEFSPVWHHYLYKEKPTFVYKSDYNLDTPLEISLDLERIIVESFIDRVRSRQATGARTG